MEQLKILLGIAREDTSKDPLLELILDETRDYILSYCHLREIPTKLQSLVPFMAADLYRNKKYGTENTPTDIKSISEGSRSVSYETIRSEDIFEQYSRRLNPYRKARTPSEITDDMEA
ncbi:MAG: phage head-tail connector protein [Candidatus Ornithomonoglobus sp.]